MRSPCPPRSNTGSRPRAPGSAEVVDQCVEHGHGLVPAIEPDVNVDAVDDHLAAPPLRAVDELRVALLVRDRLEARRAERVAARGEELDADAVRDAADGRHGGGEVRLGLGHGGVDVRDEFDRVEEQLLVDAGTVSTELGCSSKTRRITSGATDTSSPPWRSTRASSHSMPIVDCFDAAKSMSMAAPAFELRSGRSTPTECAQSRAGRWLSQRRCPSVTSGVGHAASGPDRGGFLAAGRLAALGWRARGPGAAKGAQCEGGRPMRGRAPNAREGVCAVATYDGGIRLMRPPRRLSTYG